MRDIQSLRSWQFSTKERTSRKAEQEAIRRIEERISKEKERGRKANLEKAIHEWISLKTVTPKTIQDLNYAKNVLLPHFEGLLVEEVETVDVERFLKVLYDKGRSARTRQFYLNFLRSFFRWSRRRRYCAHDPTDGLSSPRVPKRQPVILTPKEARRLLDACREKVVVSIESAKRGKWTQTNEPPAHLFLATLVALYTGLRRGNILRLRWRHLDLENQVIRIPAEEMKAHADHLVPIRDELASVFQKLLSGRTKVNSDELVIGELTEFKKSWKSATKRAGVTLTFHGLRKTFASWLAEDAPYAVVQALLGHSLPDVTGRYVKVSLDRMRRAINALPSLLADTGEESSEKADQKVGEG